MKNIFSKIMMAILAVTLVFATLPVTSAFAQDEQPPAKAELTDEKLEQVWARIVKGYERISKGFVDTDGHIARFQSLIDKAAANGKDVSELQSALDAYEAALIASKPEYDALSAVINSHAGFDADGKVTDSEQALATVQDVREKMQALKSSMDGTFKALRETFREFREANKPLKEKDKE